MKVMHQKSWKDFLEKNSIAHVKRITMRIEDFIRDSESFKTKTKEKIDRIEELLKPSKEELDKSTPEHQMYIKKYLNFRAYYPDVAARGSHLFTQEIQDSKTECFVTTLHTSEIQKCLPALNVNWDEMTKLPIYRDLSTGKPLETIENNQKTQKLLEMFDNDVITKLKVSNAYLKVYKNKMHEFHLECKKEFFVQKSPLFMYDKRIKPCIDFIQNYKKTILEVNQDFVTGKLPSDCDIILNTYIKKSELIKIQLDKLQAEIEKDAQELIESKI
jgi:hypothetical protein